MRLYRRTLTMHQIGADTDTVIAAVPIPAGGSLQGVWLESHVASIALPFTRVGMYGVTGFVLPVLDPDAGQTFDQIWDLQVPKDTSDGAGAFDMDTAGVDSTAEFDVGQLDIAGGIMESSSAPLEIFRRRKILSVSNSPFVYLDSTIKYHALDTFNTHIKRRVRVDVPSVFILGFSSPGYVETESLLTTPTEKEWSMLQYVEVVLENAFMNLIGLTESGAETPFVESSSFLANFLEQAAVDPASGPNLASTTWSVTTKATYCIDVPGRPGSITLSSEGG